jgi:hypothetical protein
MPLRGLPWAVWVEVLDSLEHHGDGSTMQRHHGLQWRAAQRHTAGFWQQAAPTYAASI